MITIDLLKAHSERTLESSLSTKALMMNEKNVSFTCLMSLNYILN